MLRRLRRFIGQQRLIPWVGEFKETLAQAAFWFTIVNFIMIAGTFYFTTIRYILPWFKLPIFIAVAFVGGLLILIIEFKFITPSIWAFRGKQMDLKNSVARSNNLVTVAVSGHFDPLNGLGHLSHIQDARKLGDKLVVILNRDDQIVAKRNNDTFYPSIEDRIAIVRELKSVDEVVVCLDKDGTVAETLRLVRPHIFAKGGDRDSSNMPKNELVACNEIGCQVVYNVGATKKASSSLLISRSRK